MLQFGKMKALRDYSSCVLAEEQAFLSTINSTVNLKSLFSNHHNRIHGAPLPNMCNMLIQKHCGKPMSMAPMQAAKCIQWLSQPTARSDASNDVQDAFAKRDRCTQASRHGYERCASIMKQACAATSIKAIKVIRLQMTTAIKYLHHNPDVKLIFYTRDPRGIIHSRIKLNYLSSVSMHNPGMETKLLCRKMEADLDAIFKSINYRRSTFERILVIKYEDLVEKPLEILQSVYSFLELDVPEEVTKWLENSMGAERNDASLFGTQRKNGTDTAYNWKVKLRGHKKRWMTNVCKSVLQTLAYEL